jgi:hypothetical protein
MRVLAACLVALALAAAAAGQSPVAFKRPDCSPYRDSLKPQRKCVREIRRSWQEANFAALQKAGLMFVYMARPDVKAGSDAIKVVRDKIEGSFVLRFSVGTDGTVSEVQTVEVTEGIQPLARLWADTIRQWTFARINQPVTGIEFRRIYLYSKEDDDDSPQMKQDEH